MTKSILLKLIILFACNSSATCQDTTSLLTEKKHDDLDVDQLEYFYVLDSIELFDTPKPYKIDSEPKDLVLTYLAKQPYSCNEASTLVYGPTSCEDTSYLLRFGVEGYKQNFKSLELEYYQNRLVFVEMGFEDDRSYVKFGKHVLNNKTSLQEIEQMFPKSFMERFATCYYDIDTMVCVQFHTHNPEYYSSVDDYFPSGYDMEYIAHEKWVLFFLKQKLVAIRHQWGT